MISLEIPGKPIPFQSPRVYERRTFNPLQRQKEQIQWIIKQICEQHSKTLMFGPVVVHIEYAIQIPKQFSKKKKRESLENTILPCSKPDLDNLAKFYLDCLKGICIQDDSYVVELILKKRYQEESSTKIKIWQFHEYYR